MVSESPMVMTPSRATTTGPASFASRFRSDRMGCAAGSRPDAAAASPLMIAPRFWAADPGGDGGSGQEPRRRLHAPGGVEDGDHVAHHAAAERLLGDAAQFGQHLAPFVRRAGGDVGIGGIE